MKKRYLNIPFCASKCWKMHLRDSRKALRTLQLLLNSMQLLLSKVVKTLTALPIFTCYILQILDRCCVRHCFSGQETFLAPKVTRSPWLHVQTSSLDKNNFIHFPPPPGLMILKMYHSISVVVPVHLDAESWLPLTLWERNFIKMFN